MRSLYGSEHPTVGEAALAIAAVDSPLIRRDSWLALLFDPPFDRSQADKAAKLFSMLNPNNRPLPAKSPVVELVDDGDTHRVRLVLGTSHS